MKLFAPYLFFDPSRPPASIGIAIPNIQGFRYFELAVIWRDMWRSCDISSLGSPLSAVRGKRPTGLSQGDCGRIRRQRHDGRSRPIDKHHERVCKDDWTRVGFSGDALTIDYL